MVEILPDGPWVHEEAWNCWQGDLSCCVVPRGFPDPAAYLSKYKGPPALFQYVLNAYGGFDLLPFEWRVYEERFASSVTPAKDYMDVTWTIADNNIGYGLLFGRLFPKWLGKKVVPYLGLVSMGETLRRNDVTLIICDANHLAEHLLQEVDGVDTLRAIVNVCRVLPVAKAEALENKFNVPVFTALGHAHAGMYSWDRAKDLLRGQAPTVIIEHKYDGKRLLIRPAVPSPHAAVDNKGYMSIED